MRFAFKDRAEPLFRNHLNWCALQWLVSFLWCWLQADCLSVNTCDPCELCCFESLARGLISQTDISTTQEMDDFCFVLFSWDTLLCQQQGVFDLMLEFFFMMVCDFAECMFVRLKKNKGDLMLKWCFSVKLGNLMTHLPKHPRLNIWYDLFILPLFAWCKLSPKLNGCDFLSCNLLLHVLYIETTFFNLCLIYFMGWPDPQKGFF